MKQNDTIKHFTQNRLTPLSGSGHFPFPSVSSPPKNPFWIGLMFCIDDQEFVANLNYVCLCFIL